jgi:Transglutaminase-like superfamily
MSFLFFKAYFELLRFEFYLKHGDFRALHDVVRRQKIAARPCASEQEVLTAVDVACVWYWKPVLCLQRSAATTCLLKRHGISAQLVLGAQQVPFRAHAWVEITGRVVNDKSYVPQIYSVLDRC